MVLKNGDFFSALPGLGVSALQGVWGKTYESSIKKRYKTAYNRRVKSGEEWVKSARTLFTPRNADKHRGFGAFDEE